MTIADFPDILKDACLNNDVDKLSQCILIDKVLTIKLLKGDDFYKVKNMFGLEPIPNSYMYIACEHNSFEVVKQLLLHGVCDVNSPSIKNQSPILVACEKGSLECLKEMTSFGISLHPSNTVTKDSCIYVATIFGQTCVVEYIVNSTHDILEKVFEGGLGQNPDISYAEIWAGLSNNVKTENKIKSGSLLLYIACLLKHFDIVKFLLAQGVNANKLLMSTKSFYSSMFVPLAVACKNNDLKIAEILFENGAEITSSIANHYPDIIALLLQSRVKILSECDNREGNFSFINTSSECYSLCWSNLRLHKLHKHWLSNNSENIYMLDLHDNSIEDIPSEFFDLLPNVKEVDLSCNLLREFPHQSANLSKIIKVVARKNKLKTLPLSLFNNPNITHIDFSANEIINLPTDPEKLWECTMLKHLRLSINKIISIPSSISGANSLEKLYLSDNLIQSFECSWKCPLNELDLSNNQLVEFCPSLLWSKTLTKLNLSKNQLESISSSICHLENLQYLDLSFNTLRVLPPPDLWKCESLCKLNLSHNLLSASTHTDGFVGVDMNTLVEAMGANTNLSVITSCEFPVELFSENLTNLDLSYNLLENIPESLCFLINIQELNLSNNPCLTVLPAELSLLKNVWSLRLSGLNIPDLPFELDDKNLTKQVMPYLCAKLRKSVPFNRMKLMVVGLQARGKTTLVATLQGKKPPPNISTVGISVEQWSLALPQRLSISFWRDTSNNEEIKFSCWDLAGQHVYYATHQCFLTSNTLYLVVFNVTHGWEGVDSLAPWLLNIQSRAPLSRVIIVGTHIDCLPVQSKASTLLRLKDEILMKYDKKGFPLIASCNFVSNITSEGLVDLRIEIYNAAKLINESSSHGLCRKKAPLSYVQLYDRILKENEARKEKLLPPILNTDEMLQLAQQNPDNDIYTVEELVTASKFLHENGILLHFNDHMRELNTLYFIDPSWLCEMLSLVVTVRERNPFVLDGYIKKTDLLLVLRNPRLPEKFIPQYLRLLERFEIVLQLDDERFLIPSMLPIKRPDDVDCILQLSYKNIKRNYFMHYIPPGFWSRLIARTIIALTRWGTGLSAEVNDEEDYKTIFWREGILVLFNNCYFLVESFVENFDNVDQVDKGIAITVASQQHNYSAMAFVVDHLDALITEWYPGLEDVDEFGDSLVNKLIPCPICVSKLENNSLHKKYSFTLSVCALAAVNHQHILCARHPDVSVPLNLLVPDLLLTDLPSEFVISSIDLDFNTAESNRLGEGGAGGVYLGRYKSKQVAIKQFHSATTSRKMTLISKDVETSSVYIPVTESSLKMQIEESKVLKGFWELRQEVAILCRLKHPNIVNFVGVCYRPFCFLLELAPMGSLHSTLVKTKNDKDHMPMVGPLLGELLTLKIALQVAKALNYLHDSEIVYRDLKSDNILLWSLNENDCINVKLSDYGISTFATPQGVVGEGGTPGFQAPEVKTGCSYDEKVDIFSYGIWLYELVSGNRPYRECKSATEMKRAVQKGVRPSLYKDEIDIKMPYIEELMKDCWQEKPNQRPSAYEVVSRLQNISTYLLKHILEDTNCLNKVTCVGEWLPENKCEVFEEKNQPLLLLWCHENNNRTCIVVDIENKLVVKKVACAGSRVLCLLQVEKFIWLGTEGEQIEVFGQTGSTEERILWSILLKDHVRSLILYQNQKHMKVIASLANGTLAVFRRLQNYLHDKLSKFSRKADIVDFEKRKWSDVNLIDLKTNQPAKCMVLTQFNTELWIGSGNKIVVVDPLSLKIIECIEILRTRLLIAAMVTDESNVWIACWHSSIVTQWCVNKRCLLYSFQCNSLNPLSQTLFTKSAPHIVKQETSLLSPESPESLSSDFKTKVSFFKTISNNSDIENDADGFLVSCDSFTFNNVQESSESPVIKNLCDVQESLPESSLIKKFKHSQGLMFKTFKKNSIKKKLINTVDVDDSSILRPRTSALSKKKSNENCYVTCLYYNGNALWIGRSLGDIIILNTKINDEKFGCVIAHLDKMYDKQLNKGKRSTFGFAPLKEYNCLVSVIRIEDNALEKHQLYHYKAMNIDELFDVENKLFREYNL